MKNKTQKLVTVIIRGCKFRVTPLQAADIIKTEKEMLAREWNNNNLID